MFVDKGDVSLSSGLLKRAYLIFILCVGSIVCFLSFIIFVELYKLEDGLKRSNSYHMMRVMSKLETIHSELAYLLEDNISDEEFYETIADNDILDGIFLTDNNFTIIKSYSKFQNDLSSLKLFNYKDHFNKYGFFISKFIYLEPDHPNIFIILPYVNGVNLVGMLDASKLASFALLDDANKYSYMMDSEGFIVLDSIGSNIYDTFNIDYDWKNSQKMHLSVDYSTKQLSFYSVEFNKGLNLAIISKEPFFDIFNSYLVVIAVAIILLVFACLVLIDNIIFLKRNVISPISKLKSLLSGLEIGEIDVNKFKSNKDFDDICYEILNLYTSQVIAKNDLRDYKEQYALIFQKSSIKILFVDAKNGQIIEASESAIEFYGYDKDMLLTMNVFDLQATSLYDYSYSKLADMNDDENIYCSHRLANGDLKIVQIKITPVSSYLNDFYFMIIWDATENQKMIENLNKEKHLLLSSPILIATFKVDENWKIIQISNNVSDILGYNIEDILFKNFSFRSIIHKEDIANLIVDIKHRMKLIDTPYETDNELDRLCRIKLSNGNYDWFKVFIKISKDANGDMFVTVFMFNSTNQKLTEDIFKDKINKYQNLLWATSGMSFEYDIKKRVYTFSNSFINLLGYRNSDDLGVINSENISKIVYKSDLDKVVLAWDNYLKGLSPSINTEIRCIAKDGRYIWVCIKAKTATSNLDGTPNLISGMLEDITIKKESEAQLQLIASVFSYSREGIMITDLNGLILDVNDAFVQITGYGKEEVRGKYPNMLKSDRHNNKFYAKIWADIKQSGFWRGEIWNKRKNGQIYPEILTISAVKNQLDEVQHYVAIFYDITYIKENETRLEKIAHYDPLTKLPNRFLLLEKLAIAMNNVKENGKKIAVIYLDLDGFKKANDTYGHNCGDGLLVAISSRMQGIISNGDNLIARFGGDEFVALINDVSDENALIKILDDMLLAARDKTVINSNKIQVSTSIGVAFYDRHSDISMEDLLKRADWAMYHAKLSGKNRYYIFDENRDEIFNQYNESLLSKDKFDSDEFFLMYQPVVNIKDAKITSFEVLLRWKHPQKGIMLPVDFLHIFSDKVWFDELTIWIIINALRDSEDIFNKGIKLSINISFEQLNDEIFFAKFKDLYKNSDLRFDMLEIEITDAMSVKDIENEILNLVIYEDLGIKFVFDDFGSSLSLANTMKTAPTNTYKINKKYALELLDRADNVDMLQTILNICSAFKKRAIIKGVENEYIYNIVANIGFVELQGNFISKPIFKDDISDMINTIYIKRVFNPNLEKIPLYKFIIYQINAIKQIIISIENYNTSIFDYSTYRKVYDEFDRLKEVPESCKEADKLITLVFSSNFINKEEIAYLLNELEHKKLNILNTIIGE